MTFQNVPVSLCGVAALLLACQQEGPKDDNSNAGSGGTTAAGATAGMPAGSGVGGSAGTEPGGSGSGGSPALGGMAGTPALSGGAPGAGGAEAAGGAPVAGSAGLAGSEGGAPAAGMSGAGAGATSVAGAGGDLAAGAGGTLESAGMGGLSAAAGTGGAAVGCSDGCAELSVPFTAWKAGQYFEIYLNSATDLSTAVISVKARKVAGKAGGLLIVVKDGSAQSYAYAQGAWNALSDLTSEFKTFTLDVAAPSSTDMNNTFTPTAVQIITVQLAAGDPWYTDEAMTIEDPTALLNPTVIQIDEISIAGTGTLPGPWTFTTDASSLKATITDDGVNASPPYAVTGSTVTWLAP